jgi:sulfatase maturation enzyme AslB (radical SAM superfamily)
MEKFQDMNFTAKGEDRASVRLNSLKTLWFNTGTLCNLSCENCYIESSPTNDRLSYLTKEDVESYLIEIKDDKLPVELIALTGGEPFINPSIISILDTILAYGHETLVLTNAYRILKRHQENLLGLKEKYGDKLKLRISLDHFTKEVHEAERGAGTFDKTLDQLKWLYDHGFDISIASRSLTSESSDSSIAGHQKILLENGVDIDLSNKLVIFPEMQSKKDVPEITTACWSILSKSPDDQMCSSERMIVKNKESNETSIMPCTLLAYDQNFNLGKTLKEHDKDVFLNHRFCAEFCVLGGASCSSTK